MKDVRTRPDRNSVRKVTQGNFRVVGGCKRMSVNLKSIGTSPLSPAFRSRYRPRVDKTSMHFFGVLKSCSWRMGTLPLYREPTGTAFVHRPAAWRCKCLAIAQITCGKPIDELLRIAHATFSARCVMQCSLFFLVSRPQGCLNCDFAVATNYDCLLA